MLCYRDMTFCDAKDCANLKCLRNTRNTEFFHPDDFWKEHVAMWVDYAKTCPNYKKEEPKDDSKSVHSS